LANSTNAIEQGFTYQSRFFWLHAASLLDLDRPNVVEVSYEADAFRGFDDVVVRYDPPRPSSGSRDVTVDYHQIKFHVVGGADFGYKDLTTPSFTGGQSVSILQRLATAKAMAPPDAAFTLVTTDRIRSTDQLRELHSNVDNALRLDKLFVKGGARSRMGEVRKLWRDHLGLLDDEALKMVLEGFRIIDGHRSLDGMRNEVNERFRVVGLVSDYQSIEFRFDAVAQELKFKRINRQDRTTFRELCEAQKWFRAGGRDEFVNVNLRSFDDGLAAEIGAGPDDSLLLLRHFDGRRLKDGGDWARDVVPEVKAFLERARGLGRKVRLNLNVHTSLAFLAGSLLGFKTGVDVELVQRGQNGPSVWRADDGADGPDLKIATEAVGPGHDLALVVGLTWDIWADVADFVTKKLPEVGRVIRATPEGSPGQSAVRGGAHAARIADQVASALRAARPAVGTTVHVFVSGPNAFTFALGRNRAAMGSVVLYEFDFERRYDASYQPSFRIT
jgi:hypothetical protein